MDEAYVDYVAGDPTRGHRQRPRRATRRSPRTSSSRPTSRAARRTSRRAGTRSSSCCGARTGRRTGPARGRRATTRRAPNAHAPRRLPAPDDRSGCVDDLAQRARRSGRPSGGAFRTAFLADPDARADDGSCAASARSRVARAGRRADGGRVREPRPGGRALLLQRQHERRRRQRHQGHPDGLRRPSSPASSGPSLQQPRRGGAIRELAGELRSADRRGAGQGAGVPGDVRDDDRRARRLARARGDGGRHRATSRRRARRSREAAEALGVKVELRGLSVRRAERLAAGALRGRRLRVGGGLRRGCGGGGRASPPATARCRAAPARRSSTRPATRSRSRCRSCRAAERRAFAVGNSFFNRNWVTAPASTTGRDGLGPTFNAQSCSSCHFKDGRAQPPARTRATPSAGCCCA